jgi:hypothetical protein
MRQKDISTPQPDEATSPITTRAYAADKFANLKGHEYIRARNLGKLERPVQTSALDAANGGKL